MKVKCWQCHNELTKKEAESYVRGYPFPQCDECTREEKAEAYYKKEAGI